MTSATERRYRRLLRWYPRRWRRENSEIVVSTMLDTADHDGRASPTAREIASAAAHGLSAHLDARLATGSSVAALLVVAVGGSLAVGDLVALADPLQVVVMITALSGAAPALAAVALVAAARERGWFSDARALVAVLLSLGAFALVPLAALAWSGSFDAADEGVAATGLAAGFLPLVVATAVSATALIALWIDAFLVSAIGRRVVSALTSTALGAAASPVLLISVIAPTTAVFLALAGAGIALALCRPAGSITTRSSSAHRIASARHTAHLLALVSASGSLVGFVYAFTAAAWSPAATDSTVALNQGFVILFVSSLPLLAAVGIRSVVASPLRPRHTTVPVLLLGVALLLLAAGSAHGPSEAAVLPWLQASSVCGGVAIAVWMIPRIPYGRGAAVAIAAAAGLVYAGIAGVLLGPVLAVFLALGSFVIAGLGFRRPRAVDPVAAEAPEAPEALV